MKKSNRKSASAVLIVIALTVGMALPSEELFARSGGENWCWSADNVATGGGYYRCKPALKCYWVEDRLPEGEIDLCKNIEDETIN
ncbi:MAG: hypothetical protein Roseis2KO_23520 [Roseivirga sp.]